MPKKMPNEWLPPAGERLSEVGLPVRFAPSDQDEILRLSKLHGLSLAAVVRILVHRSLAELARPSRVA